MIFKRATKYIITILLASMLAIVIANYLIKSGKFDNFMDKLEFERDEQNKDFITYNQDYLEQ